MIQLESVVLREIGGLSRTIHAICDQEYRQYTLQKGQFIFLTRICENPGIGFMDLSILLKVDKTTTTKAVQKLITEGYVSREGDAEDKRKSQLFPTERALGIYDAIIEEENKTIGICFQNLTQEEQAQVCRLVSKMRKNIETDWRELKNYKE